MGINRVSRADLKLGMLVPWDVYASNGMLLVRKGHLIANANQIDYLVERGSYEDHGDAKAPAPAPATQSVLRKLNTACLELQQALELVAARLAPQDTVRRLEEVALLVTQAVDLSADVAVASILHNQQAAPYAVRHSVDTAVLAQLAARALRHDARAIFTTTLAALTMNVGMQEQSLRLHESKEKLSPQDLERMRQHPQRGAALLRHAGVSDPEWLACVLHHHENEDGSGYPGGKDGAEIPVGAKLIALADRYCARVVSRHYLQPLLPNAALRDILLEGRSVLDGQLAAVMIRELGIYPVGTWVKLLNGEVGVVSRKGLRSTTPHVESVIGPRGAPLNVFLQRDTRGELHAIRDVLAPEQVLALGGQPLRMEQVWGRLARP
ncbi:HD-GYP domain-containing protein [Rugamonas apoptosis]|nr:HD domain-containing phosphohydrolase [Rugamonas apoptosis]